MLTKEQKIEIRKGLEVVTHDRIGFIRWMIRIFKASATDHWTDFQYHRIGYD